MLGEKRAGRTTAAKRNVPMIMRGIVTEEKGIFQVVTDT